MVNVRTLSLAVLALLCVAAVPASSAVAARRSPARPSISSVGPSTVAIGDTLTIRGRGFLSGPRRNTVTFSRAGAHAVSVKAGEATSTRLRVVVPAQLSPYLSDTTATRFRVRVRARRLSKASSAPRRSVLVSPPDTGADAGDDPVADECVPPDPLGDVTGTLDGALGTDLGELIDPLPPDAGCDLAAAGDDPAGADDGADPAPPDDGATDPVVG